jgi:hypothetical protein
VVNGAKAKTPRDAARAVWPAGVLLLGLVTFSRVVRAHSVGLSTADFSVEGDGSVQARLTFATAEPLGGLSLDRDHDGVVTQEDVAAARDDLRAFLLQGVEVDADGSACSASFRDADLSERDGLVLEASFACPRDSEVVEVTLFYLNALPSGHREIGRMVAGERTASAVLTADHRAMALRVREPLRGQQGASRFSKDRAVILLGAVCLLGSLGWRARRWRRPP